MLLTSILADSGKEEAKEVSLNNNSDNSQLSYKTSNVDSHVILSTMETNITDFIIMHLTTIKNWQT